MKTGPGETPAPARWDRRDALRDYLRATIREHFTSKAELVSLAGLDKLRRTLTEDLGAALAGIGLTPAAAAELGAEAVGAALAKKAVGWLFGRG